MSGYEPKHLPSPVERYNCDSCHDSGLLAKPGVPEARYWWDIPAAFLTCECVEGKRMAEEFRQVKADAEARGKK
jgi:hypothetical protein